MVTHLNSLTEKIKRGKGGRERRKGRIHKVLAYTTKNKQTP